MIGAYGVGLACATEATGDPERDRNALLFLNARRRSVLGAQRAELPFLGRLRAGFGWQPEAFDSLAVQPGGLLAFVRE